MERIRWDIVLAVVATTKSLAAWFFWSFLLVPDASLYVENGIAIFPSIPGTIIGNILGWNGLAVANAIAAGVCVYFAGVLAARSGGSRYRAAIAATILPLAVIYPMYLSIDTLALAVFLGAIILLQERRNKLGTVALIASATMHLALVPIAAIYPLGVKYAERWIRPAIIIAVFLVTIIGLFTDYGAVLNEPHHFSAGMVAGLLSCIAALVLFGPALMTLNIETRVISWAFFAAFFGAIAAAASMSSGDPTHFNMRYFVPATFLAASLYGARHHTPR